MAKKEVIVQELPDDCVDACEKFAFFAVALAGAITAGIEFYKSVQKVKSEDKDEQGSQH